jgi:hypothetical protein
MAYAKRVQSEIMDLLKDSGDSEQDIQTTYKHSGMVVKINGFEFTLGKDYPFCKPVVSLNNKSYGYYLASPSPRIIHLMTKHKIACFCCHTVLCHWSPAHRMKTIMNEHELMKDTKVQIKYLLLIGELMSKYPLLDPVRPVLLEFLGSPFVC